LCEKFLLSRNRVTLKKAEKLIDLILARCSTRSFLPDVPDRQLIDRLIDCAASAPNAHNAQPWKFYILEDGERKMVLLRKMMERFAQDLERDKVSLQEIDRRTFGSVETFSKAPVLVLTCLDMTDMTVYADEPRAETERIMGIQSVAAATQNLLLAAWAHGLGGCWYCAPLFCQGLIQKNLGLPQTHEPQAFITIGYPDTNTLKPLRKPIDEIRFRL
jgi:F420 biosynthesis protein FbiB-like protein